MALRQPNGTEPVGTTDERETRVETSTGELLALLDADYTREILEAIRDEPRSARTLATECGASRPTVYRRLNDLQEAGLVETDMTYGADGHHRTVFEATLERLSVEVTGDGLAVTVMTGRRDPSPPRSD